MGFDFTRPRAELLAAGAGPSEPTFEYTVKGATTRARELDGEFVVLKGSTASARPANSWDSYRSLHKELIDDGVLTLDPSNAERYIFGDDYPFKNPSAAGAVVGAVNVSGRAAWRVSGTGETYGEWQDANIEASAPVPTS